MTRLSGVLALAAAVVVAVAPAAAKEHTYFGHQMARWLCKPDQSQLLNWLFYWNHYPKLVHSPSETATGAPILCTAALCKDDTYSFSHHNRGTCSHHHGVRKWIHYYQ